MELPKTKPIPKEELRRASRTMARNVASVILRAMAYRDCSFEDVDYRLGKRSGYARRLVMRLADGRAGIGMRILADLAYALDVRMTFTITPMENQQNERRGNERTSDAGADASGDDAGSQG